MEPPEDRAAHETRPTPTPPTAPPAAPLPAAVTGALAPEGPGARIPGGPPPARAAHLAAEVPAAREHAAADPDGGPGGLRGLSLPGRIVVALAVAAVSVGAVFHIGMVFLQVAPANTLSTQHAQAVSDYIYPEFEQNWKLFAPDPVQVNTDVEARAEVTLPGGATTTTGWVDLTAMDIAQIRHDPIPSHTAQNELRRCWDFYTSAHDAQDRPIGLRGTLSQQYLLRIVAHRFGPHLNGGTVRRVQVRVATTPVASPSYSAQKNTVTTSYRVLSWWNTTPEDFS